MAFIWISYQWACTVPLCENRLCSLIVFAMFCFLYISWQSPSLVFHFLDRAYFLVSAFNMRLCFFILPQPSQPLLTAGLEGEHYVTISTLWGLLCIFYGSKREEVTTKYCHFCCWLILLCCTLFRWEEMVVSLSYMWKGTWSPLCEWIIPITNWYNGSWQFVLHSVCHPAFNNVLISSVNLRIYIFVTTDC